MKDETILVIDDDRDLRESIVEILEDNGLTATGCGSAEEALDKIKIKVPSLVIVDNMMPGMGGLALMPLLKNDYPWLKIIMITAFSTVDNAVAAMKGGADDYLSKPFKRNELLVAVKQNLEELRFEKQLSEHDMDSTLTCLSNGIRRQILTILAKSRKMRFMDITRNLEISDHTKVNFHLKNLKANSFITQDSEKNYILTPQGKKIIDRLHLFLQNLSK